ncbi:hypothetical protein C0J52_16562 [Blattella germanica]|nr:hypothetical protein C0J52_16562 [Blattella germanica]
MEVDWTLLKKTKRGYRKTCPGMESPEIPITAPDTGTPTPTPPSSVTPSPPPQQEHSDDDEDGYQRFAAMNPPPMLQNGSPDCLPIDHNLPHLLKQVSGNSDLSTVRDIRLRVISRDMSLQRLALFIPNLRELNLDGSCLGSLRDLGCGLMSLQVLRVARCGLESLDGTFGITSLRELYASNNRVDDVGPCSCLSHIRTLDLSKNAVEDISFLEFLNVCPHLEDLSLAECPAASRPGYRNRVCRLLPNLTTLDGVPTSEIRGDGDTDNNNSNDIEDNRYEMEEYPSNEGASIVQQSPQSPLNHGDGSVGFSFMSAHSDASSSCYQADLSHDFSKIKDAQESNSESTLSKANQKRNLKIKIRPATAGAVPINIMKRGPLRTSTPTKHRPATASVHSEKSDPNTSSSDVADDRRDSPSALTSGRVVCGNLTMALRNRRRRQDAWTEDAHSSHEEDLTGIQNDSIVEEKAEENSTIKIDEENESFESIPSDSMNVLEESKKWRELYASYRSQNRVRWEKEKDESMKANATNAETSNSVVPDNDEAARRIREEKLNHNETKPRKVEENKKAAAAAIKKFQSRNTCSPHLFSRQNQTHDSSYDADGSSGMDMSPEEGKSSGPKKVPPHTKRF